MFFYYFFKNHFLLKLFSDCCNQSGYPRSIVYLSCLFYIVSKNLYFVALKFYMNHCHSREHLCKQQGVFVMHPYASLNIIKGRFGYENQQIVLIIIFTKKYENHLKRKLETQDFANLFSIVRDRFQLQMLPRTILKVAKPSQLIKKHA